MRKEKMNNKGFSLVELIIVVAIMAILVVALAPQYLKYVEKSRNSTDVNNATAMVTAIQVYAADPDAAKPFVKDATFKLEVASTGTSLTDTAAGSVDDALKAAALSDYASIECKSKTTWTTYTIEGEVQDDGSIEFTYTGTDFAAAMK